MFLNAKTLQLKWKLLLKSGFLYYKPFSIKKQTIFNRLLLHLTLGNAFLFVCTKDRHELLWNVGATFGRPQESPQGSEYGTIFKIGIDHIGKIYNPVVAWGRRTTYKSQASCLTQILEQLSPDERARILSVVETMAKPYALVNIFYKGCRK